MALSEVRRSGRPGCEAGFTIIEVMAALVVIAVAFLGLATVQAVSSKAHSLGNNQGVAMMIAQEQIERMRRRAFADIQDGGGTLVIDGVNYGFIRTVTNLPSARKVDIGITWTDRFGTQGFGMESIVSQVTNP